MVKPEFKSVSAVSIGLTVFFDQFFFWRFGIIYNYIYFLKLGFLKTEGVFHVFFLVINFRFSQGIYGNFGKMGVHCLGFRFRHG